MKFILSIFICVRTLDYDDHNSFSEHYANALSTFKQVSTIDGVLYKISLKLSTISELGDVLQKCLTLAGNGKADYAFQEMCYQQVFNDDYFWL